MVIDLLTLVFCLLFPVSLERLRRQHINEAEKTKELDQLRNAQLKKYIAENKVLTSMVLESTQQNCDAHTELTKLIVKYELLLKEQSAYLSEKLTEVKDLAVSDMMVARRNELSRLYELKSVLERMISITTISRQIPATVDVLTLESVNKRIEELGAILR
jgi:hypothetical protein